MPEPEVVHVAIYLTIEGKLQDALEVVDALLDNGVPQDSINEHEVEGAGPLHVKSAIVRSVDAAVVEQKG